MWAAALGPEAAALEAEARPVPPDELPPLPRKLLCHENNMTAALARHHGVALEEVRLEVLREMRQHDGTYLRMIHLKTPTGTVIEQALIRIHLSNLPSEIHEAILSKYTPFGAILLRHNIPQRCTPQAFFALGARFGRRNAITDPTSNALLADVIEIVDV